MKRLLILLALVACHVHCARAERSVDLDNDVSIVKLTDRCYLHVSLFEFAGYGKVSCNGLVYVDNGQACIIDTPTNEEQTQTLCRWVADSLGARITAFIPTHWHRDCIGGISILHRLGAASHANRMTIDICRKEGIEPPKNGFVKSDRLAVGDSWLRPYYPGAGHSLDNIVVWIESENILFGGCFIKDRTSVNLGNTADGDPGAWAASLRDMRDRFPDAAIVVPGHGPMGDMSLVDHTLGLLRENGYPAGR